MDKVALLHSGGKDSVLALAALQRDPSVENVTLLVTLTEENDRVSMHGVSRALMEAQAASLRSPLKVVHVPRGASNERYEREMSLAVEELRHHGITAIATGDLHLQDIRTYREAWLGRLGMRATFPLWGRAPATIVRELLDAGYRTAIVCIDRERMPMDSLGGELDQAWLDGLPAGIDPCGEAGEFHTFVHDGPGFAFPIPIAGRLIRPEGRFAFADLQLGPSSTCTQCGAPFTCAATDRTPRCWCMDAPPVHIDPTRATCSCPRCLKAQHRQQ